MYVLSKNTPFIWYCRDSITTEYIEGREMCILKFTLLDDLKNFVITTRMRNSQLYMFKVEYNNNRHLYYPHMEIDEYFKREIKMYNVAKTVTISWCYKSANMPLFEGIVFSLIDNIPIVDSETTRVCLDFECVTKKDTYYIVNYNLEGNYCKVLNNTNIFQMYVKSDSSDGSFCPGWYLSERWLKLCGTNVEFKLNPVENITVLVKY